MWAALAMAWAQAPGRTIWTGVSVSDEATWVLMEHPSPLGWGGLSRDRQQCVAGVVDGEPLARVGPCAPGPSVWPQPVDDELARRSVAHPDLDGFAPVRRLGRGRLVQVTERVVLSDEGPALHERTEWVFVAGATSWTRVPLSFEEPVLAGLAELCSASCRDGLRALPHRLPAALDGRPLLAQSQQGELGRHEAHALAALQEALLTAVPVPLPPRPDPALSAPWYVCRLQVGSTGSPRDEGRHDVFLPHDLAVGWRHRWVVPLQDGGRRRVTFEVVEEGLRLTVDGVEQRFPWRGQRPWCPDLDDARGDVWWRSGTWPVRPP